MAVMAAGMSNSPSRFVRTGARLRFWYEHQYERPCSYRSWASVLEILVAGDSSGTDIGMSTSACTEARIRF